MSNDRRVVSIGLAGAHVPGEPCQGVVELLREWLADAERGDLVQVLIAGVRAGHHIRTEWAGAAGMNDCLAAVTGLQARVASAWVSEMEREV